MLGKAHVRGIREGYRSVYVAFLIGSCTDFHTVCWAADNSSTVSMCMFLLVFDDTEGLPPVSKANLVVLVWVLFGLWPLPLFASLLFLVGETQIGRGICVSLVLVAFLF